MDISYLSFGFKPELVLILGIVLKLCSFWNILNVTVPHVAVLIYINPFSWPKNDNCSKQ